MSDKHTVLPDAEPDRMVLVIDDEAINRAILGEILSEDYQVISAASAKEAWEQILRYQDTLSLILLDLILPDVNGLEILQELKDDPRLSRIPVIVISGDKDSEVECLTLGAIDFIPKPYPIPQVILARVLRIIELSENRDIIRWTERDHLTGLYNPDYFFHYSEQFDAHHKGTSMDALFLDVNHFHMINERYGKAYGDKVLQQISDSIQELVPENNGLACRRGSDTFLVYCRHVSDYHAFLDHIQAGLSDGFKGDSRIWLRLGVYADVDPELHIERRFDHAKIAADTVRGSLSKTIGFYDSVLHDSEIYAEQLLEGFDAAIRERQFTVYYQPKFNVQPDIPVLNSAEALVRWIHPTLGMISPGVFIPLFESNGLVEQLDQFVWREAAAQIKDWKTRLGIAVPVSVNVSRVDMYNPDLLAYFQNLLNDYGLTAQDILLEITESAYTQDSIQIIDTVNQLRSAGFQIEMDDFGTGYSSLNMISALPIDALKLDMQFIRTAFSERKDTRMLEVILEIAAILNVPTIAEGVETAEQMFSLKSMGCDIIQGYYFSKPLPAEEFEHFLIEKKNMSLPKGDESVGSQNQRQPYTPSHQGSFNYDALHDPVTGLYNGSAFEVLLKDADQSHIALILLNILDYESLKQETTHNIMDRLAIHIADVLRQNFRSVDYLCRLRDDEYIVIVTRVISEQHQLICRKVSLINDALSQPPNDLPSITLAAGVAFSDRNSPAGDIFQDADAALNRVRESGTAGCEIY